ncbi:hypothetical protein LNP25_28035 [Klebsiella variicola subsp. variicola]|nr:hypothetical protein [Klebsiella variicola subsp. variicola]
MAPDPGSNTERLRGGQHVICICIVKSWLISCYGREAGSVLWIWWIGNTNDSQAATVKDKLPVVDFNQSMTACDMAEKAAPSAAKQKQDCEFNVSIV